MLNVKKNGTMNKKVLTICIPSYNRKEELLKNLAALCPYLTEEVKVVVRDNCSTKYDVKTVVEEYQRTYGIELVENTVNVGMNANICKCFEMCDTDWLWVLGDDDCVQPKGIEIVLNAIKENPDAIYLKFNSTQDRCTRGLVEFSDVMKSLYEYATSFFISETVHNIRKTSQFTYWHYEYLSSMIGQILRVVKYLIATPDGKCVFLKEKILQDHGEEISWSKKELVFAYQYVFDVLRDYRKELKSGFLKGVASFSFAYIANSPLSKIDKFHFIHLVVIKYGFVNTIRYCGKTLGSSIIRSLFGDKIINIIRSFFYNRGTDDEKR